MTRPSKRKNPFKNEPVDNLDQIHKKSCEEFLGGKREIKLSGLNAQKDPTSMQIYRDVHKESNLTDYDKGDKKDLRDALRLAVAGNEYAKKVLGPRANVTKDINSTEGQSLLRKKLQQCVLKDCKKSSLTFNNLRFRESVSSHLKVAVCDDLAAASFLFIGDVNKNKNLQPFFLQDIKGGHSYVIISNLNSKKPVNVACDPWVNFSGNINNVIDYDEKFKNDFATIPYSFYKRGKDFINDINIINDKKTQDKSHLAISFLPNKPGEKNDEYGYNKNEIAINKSINSQPVLTEFYQQVYTIIDTTIKELQAESIEMNNQLSILQNKANQLFLKQNIKSTSLSINTQYNQSNSYKNNQLKCNEIQARLKNIDTTIKEMTSAKNNIQLNPEELLNVIKNCVKDFHSYKNAYQSSGIEEEQPFETRKDNPIPFAGDSDDEDEQNLFLPPMKK